MGKTLLDKVWDLHTVRTLPSGQDQLFVGLHLVHEVTSPQAFQMLRERGLKVRFANRTVATVDHIVPADDQRRPFHDTLAEQMMAALEKNAAEFGIPFFHLGTEDQGIVHVVGPELGLSQPGMIIACGDSHTSTHGALGAIGYAYEYGGPTIESLPMESRLTVCNMSIEGGARFGYVCPDEVTDIRELRCW